MENKKTSFLYKIIKGLVRLIYPKTDMAGTEHLPKEASIIVGNHAQMNGPIVSELYIPGRHYTWCAGEMMELSEVPDYAYTDFWSGKPKGIRWFYRLLSYLIAPLSVCIFNNANTIPVYHDTRVVTTFRTSIKALTEGDSIVIFPEHAVGYNNILCGFQDKFIELARMYYRKTGKELSFVPVYIAPALRTAYFGEPVRYRAEADRNEERKRICGELMDSITALAAGLPPHRVVPYLNISKKDYPMNTPVEAVKHEKAV